jgi:hypothetical protein
MAAIAKRGAQLLHGDVRRFRQQRQDQRRLRLDPAGPAIAAPRTGRTWPLPRASARHRLTLAALTPKRAAATRWLAPADTAARTRVRRSTDNALTMPAGLPSGRQLESEPATHGNPQRFNTLGSRSSLGKGGGGWTEAWGGPYLELLSNLLPRILRLNLLQVIARYRAPFQRSLLCGERQAVDHGGQNLRRSRFLPPQAPASAAVSAVRK